MEAFEITQGSVAVTRNDRAMHTCFIRQTYRDSTPPILPFGLALALIGLAAWAPQSLAVIRSAYCQEEANSQVAEQSLLDAVKRLSDDRFQVRQAAMETLWRAGELARPMLEKARLSPDRETVSRAVAILNRFQFGLYADTPPETTRWINSFRFGELTEKRAVLDHFREQGEIARVVRLVAAEPNEAYRKNMAGTIVANIQNYAAQLPTEGSEQQWDALLSLGTDSDEGMRHYAAFLVLTERDEEKLLELNEKLKESKQGELARQVAWIHRARGDVVSAQRVAKDYAQVTMQRELAYEAKDWAVVEQLLMRPAAPAVDVSNDIEALGLQAASQRLQGDHESFSRTMSIISDLGSSKKGSMFFAAEALLINGYAEDGVAFVTAASIQEGFRLLVRQGKFKQAFQLVGIGDEKQDRDEWFKKMLQESTANRSDRDVKYELLVYGSRALHAVGLIDESLERMEQIAVASRTDKSRNERLLGLVEAAYKTGHRDVARRFAAEAILGGRASQALATLFPSQSSIALNAWRYLGLSAASNETADKVQRLIDLENLLQPDGNQKMNAADLAEFSKRWKQAQTDGTKSKRAAWIIALAEIQLIHGDEKNAVATLDSIADTSMSAAMRSAELSIASKDFEKAESALERALAIRPQDPPALYLRGWVRVQQGNHKPGQADIIRARLLPLAASDQLSRLATALKRNGLSEQAVVEWRRVLRLGAFRSWSVNDAAKQIGNTISGGNRREAAQHWEQLLFSGFKRDSRFTAIEGYLQLTHLIHKTRARVAADEGNPFAACREASQAMAAIPDDITTAEDLVPLLDKGGYQEEADWIFDQVYEFNADIIRDYPNSPMHLNNMAWVSARCNRRLQEALPLAEKANQIRPNTASYIDTLGEVYFRLNRTEDAIACAERCVKLSPGNAFYREQLARFKAALP